MWRCKICKCKKSIRTNSFFEQTNLPLGRCLELIYWWCLDINQRTMQMEVEVSSDHITVDWCNYMRQVCEMWCIDHSTKIGGIDATSGIPKIVEIDESKFFHRKYHRGQYHDGHWVLGGVERNSNSFFLVPCPENSRNAATLNGLIQDWVLPGTIIITDEWAGYRLLHGLPEDYVHHTVNHSVSFVDRNDHNINTNKCEGMWAHAKKKFKKMHGSSRGHFESYLQEFLWRNYHKENIFMQMIYWIQFYW